MRLIDLPEDVQEMLTDGSLQMGHARAILALPTDTVRRKMAESVKAGQLSVRQVEQRVRAQLAPASSEDQENQKAANIIDLETRLRSVLGTKVVIKTRKNAKRGRIIIEFYSLDEFDKLTEKMGLPPSERL
jgi:ParB family chromosome partitioning protein